MIISRAGYNSEEKSAAAGESVFIVDNLVPIVDSKNRKKRTEAELYSVFADHNIRKDSERSVCDDSDICKTIC